jgi:hypothetical protein
LLAPQVVEVVLPALLGVPAQNEKVWTVRDAQAAFGYQVPAEAHPDMRARQRERVLIRGLRPSDAGLEESEQHIGAMTPQRLRDVS